VGRSYRASGRRRRKKRNSCEFFSLFLLALNAKSGLLWLVAFSPSLSLEEAR